MPFGSANDRVVDAVSQLVLKRVADGGVFLPALPSSLANCLFLTRAADFDVNQVAQVFASEPMMMAAALKAANSAAQAPSAPITNVRTALNRLGTRGVRSLVVELAAEKIYVSKDREIRAQATRIWQHCVAVAAAAKELATSLALPSPDDAYLAGLLHDIGKPLVAGMLLESERQITQTRAGTKWLNGDQWSAVIDRSHRALGVALAERWHLPTAIVAAVRNSSDFDPVEPRSISNVVCLANALAKTMGVGTDEELADDVSDTITRARPAMGVDAALIDQLSATLKDRANHIESL